MYFTVETIAVSLANYLAQYLPGVTMYEDPNQQKTECPCMFLQQRYSYIKDQVGVASYIRRIGLDLTYLEDYNLPDLQKRYQKAAETLDLVMELFPYSDGENAGLIRTHDREWRIDLDALHYKFELQERVFIPESAVKMQAIEQYTERVVENG